jgi:hypothetical protein
LQFQFYTQMQPGISLYSSKFFFWPWSPF